MCDKTLRTDVRRASLVVSLLFLLCLSSTELRAWKAELDGGGTFDSAADMTLDPWGDPIVVGIVGGMLAIAKFDAATGVNLWETHLTEWIAGPPRVRTDAAGDVYLCGGASLNPSIPISNPMVVAKLSGSSGSVLWTHYFDEGWGTSIELDGQGGVFVSWSQLGFGQGFTVRKLDAVSGNTVWTYSLSSGDASDLAVDSAGDVVVVGVAPEGIVKLDGLTGAPLWSQSSYGETVVIDSNGDVIVGGGTSSQWALIKYDGSTGAELWFKPLGGWYGFGDLAVTSTGDVVAAGWGFSLQNDQVFSVLRAAGATGTLTWRRDYGGGPAGSAYIASRALSVAVDANDDVYAAGYLYLDSIASIRKITGSGADVWFKDIVGTNSNGPNRASTVLLDGGHLFVAGRVGNADPDLFVARLDTDDGAGLEVPMAPDLGAKLPVLWDDPLGWVFGYDDRRELVASIIDGLRNDPVLEGALWLSGTRNLLRYPDRPVVLTPDDEEAAIRWISDHREELYGDRTAGLYLFLETGGPGEELLNELIAAGLWGRPAEFKK